MRSARCDTSAVLMQVAEMVKSLEATVFRELAAVCPFEAEGGYMGGF